MRADPSRAISSKDMRTYLSGLRAKYDAETSHETICSRNANLGIPATGDDRVHRH